jgi:hypothetical protein
MGLVKFAENEKLQKYFVCNMVGHEDYDYFNEPFNFIGTM